MDIGTLVAGRYRLDRAIAAGGMGEVWRGFDTRLERRVAVKILHRDPGDPERSCDRFVREAKILASLRDPGLVEIYDYGDDTSSGRTVRYIVMELVEGTSLAAMLDERGPIPVEEALRYVAATAEVLDIAHRGGVVHRDIKPANLLIDSEGRLRLVDFGISLTDGEARLTMPGGVLGTTSYVSPEQLSGWKVCGAADIYSLGAVAYECLAGRPPFVADEPLGVVHMHLYEDPPPLPEDLPPAVVEIVMRCLRKNPEQRWPSAAALAAACRIAADTESPTAASAARPGADRRTKDGEEPAGRHRRRSRPVMFLVAVILVLTAVGLFSLWQLSMSSGAESQAEASAAQVDRTASGPSLAASGSLETTDEPDTEPAASTYEPSTVPETGEESPEPSEASAATTATGEVLPDVLGMDATEAQQQLNSLGWTDVRIVSTLLPGGSQPEGCEVVSQNPKPDRVVEYDHPVKVAYWGLHDCP